MTIEVILVLLSVVSAVILFATERFPVDRVALILMATLLPSPEIVFQADDLLRVRCNVEKIRQRQDLNLLFLLSGVYFIPQFWPF